MAKTYTGKTVNGVPFDEDGNVIVAIPTLDTTPTNGSANGVMSGGVYDALPKVADNYANDAAAAIGGIAIGKMYHTAGVVKIRLV
jgi:hypothetical protein